MGSGEDAIFAPLQADGAYNKIPIYPIFYLLQGGLYVSASPKPRFSLKSQLNCTVGSSSAKAQKMVTVQLPI